MVSSSLLLIPLLDCLLTLRESLLFLVGACRLYSFLEKGVELLLCLCEKSIWSRIITNKGYLVERLVASHSKGASLQSIRCLVMVHPPVSIIKSLRRGTHLPYLCIACHIWLPHQILLRSICFDFDDYLFLALIDAFQFKFPLLGLFSLVLISLSFLMSLVIDELFFGIFFLVLLDNEFWAEYPIFRTGW